MDTDRKIYEFSFLLSGRLNEAEVLPLFEKIEKIFEDWDGKIVRKSELEKKILTYPVKKEKEAYFGYFHLELSPDKIGEIKEKFRYENNILRYLCLTPPPNFGKMTNVGGKQKGREVKEKRETEEKIGVKETEEKLDLETLDQKLEEIKELA